MVGSVDLTVSGEAGVIDVMPNDVNDDCDVS